VHHPTDCALGAIDAFQAANIQPKNVFIVSANLDDATKTNIENCYYVRASCRLARLSRLSLP